MNPYRPHRQMAVPPTLHARMEIAKAIDSLAAQEADDRARRHAEISALRCDLEEIPGLLHQALTDRALLVAELRKYSADQPRLPKGNRHGGEWTKEGEDAVSGDSSGTSNIVTGDRQSKLGRRYAELDAGVRTDATAVGETPVSLDSDGTGGAFSTALNWLKTEAEDIRSGFLGAVGAATEAEIQAQQIRAQFGLEHPGLVLGMTATPLLVATLPEVLVGGVALETSGAALEVGGAAEEARAIVRGGVYALRDFEGTIMRIGRTGDLARRAAEARPRPDT